MFYFHAKSISLPCSKACLQSLSFNVLPPEGHISKINPYLTSSIGKLILRSTVHTRGSVDPRMSQMENITKPKLC